MGPVVKKRGAAEARRTRCQRPKQNRHVAAFDQAATWRAHKCLARGTAIDARRCGQGFDDAPPQ
ncbi:hypothetical protein DQ648_22910 [Salmonella enterica]|nr:hypothetical protein [Salmonella enterica]EBM4238908.1 hypothetical protein [Salmonella enterica]EBN2061513.1 hypothetical protein [Salmonella enterica]EBN5080214.1 hypothetical protein [Salmonella enterica]ECA0233484.1 hypothetical protein [Salmonella enterica subsp. enterica serovar Infantis]